MKTKKIDHDQFTDALHHALLDHFKIDAYDYWEFEGIRDFCRFAWRCLDKRQKWHKERVNRNDAEKARDRALEAAREEGFEDSQRHYRKLWWKFYVYQKQKKAKVISTPTRKSRI